MPGGTESNGTGVGKFPFLVLGIATRYRIFFRFGFGSDIGEFSSLVLETACCALGTDICEFALAVPFLLCPVCRLLAAGGGGAGGGGGDAMRRPKPAFKFLQEQI